MNDGRTLTAVAGIQVGHAEVSTGRSGCTVILGPFRGAVEVSGLATGSRELGVLSALHLVPQVDALLLTGGSAFGLAAADGVMEWLAQKGRGFVTGVTRVPIVPAGVIFDLAPGVERPDAATGWAACEVASSDTVVQGKVGAGAGAMVGKIAGGKRAMPGGLGSVAARMGPNVVAALAVVNALGNVHDGTGRILAGARADDGSYLDPVAAFQASASPAGMPEAELPGPAQNTTLAVVATDAPLSRVDLARLARMANAALARRISPVSTPFDGDMTFALAPSPEIGRPSPGELLALGAVARQVLEGSIESAVRESARAAPGDESPPDLVDVEA